MRKEILFLVIEIIGSVCQQCNVVFIVHQEINSKEGYIHIVAKCLMALTEGLVSYMREENS